MALTEKQKEEFASRTCNEHVEEVFGGNPPCYALRLVEELKIDDQEFIKLIEDLASAATKYYYFYSSNGFSEYHW